MISHVVRTHPEIWKPDQLLLPTHTIADRTPQKVSLGVLSRSDLECPTPPTPLWNRRTERLQKQHNDLHSHRRLQSPQVRVMYRKRAPPPPFFSFDANHMETVEIEDSSSEYDTDEMVLLNNSAMLSIDRIRFNSSDEDIDEEVQSLEVSLIRRHCTNVMQLNRTEINFDADAQSEAEALPTSDTNIANDQGQIRIFALGDVPGSKRPSTLCRQHCGHFCRKFTSTTTPRHP